MFYCSRKKARLSFEQCLDLFVDTHALNDSASPCYGCPLGARHRFRLAFDREPSRAELEKYVAYCGAGPSIGRPVLGKRRRLLDDP